MRGVEDEGDEMAESATWKRREKVREARSEQRVGEEM